MKKSIDFSESLKLVNHDKQLAIDLLSMLVKDLPHIKRQINELIDKEDLLNCRKLVHKTLGATCYCGVPYLKEALLQFQNSHRNGCHHDNLSVHAEKIIHEIDLVISSFNEIYI